MASTYVARHMLSIDGKVREPDELVPEAALWPRLQSSITTGMLRPTDVPDEVFVAAVRRYCPAAASQLARLNNLDFAKFPEPKTAPPPPAAPEPEPEAVPSLIPAPHQPGPEQLVAGENTVVHPQVQKELKPRRAPAKKEPAKKV